MVNVWWSIVQSVIKATGMTAEGKRVLFLGLGDRNIQMLVRDMPIKIDLQEWGEPFQQLVIFSGGSDRDMLERFKQMGIVVHGEQF